MALVSGGRSTLNPNAPLFIPAAVRQVEDFSPEWWDLVNTSTWFRDYWFSQHRGEDIVSAVEDGIDGKDVVGLLPDSIELDVDEDILNMEAQFEEFLQSSEAEYAIKSGTVIENDFYKNSDALFKSVNMPKRSGLKSPMESMKYWEKPAQHVASKQSPRFIQQPR